MLDDPHEKMKRVIADLRRLLPDWQNPERYFTKRGELVEELRALSGIEPLPRATPQAPVPVLCARPPSIAVAEILRLLHARGALRPPRRRKSQDPNQADLFGEL
jgi:hypothetical protein